MSHKDTKILAKSLKKIQVKEFIFNKVVIYSLTPYQKSNSFTDFFKYFTTIAKTSLLQSKVLVNPSVSAVLKETRNSFKKWPLNYWWISNKTIMEVGNITKAATFKSFFA